jgi:SnoaL-like domain
MSDRSVPRNLQDLLDIEAIKQLKADYFYLMDTKRWEDWADLFTEDFQSDGPAAHDAGRDPFVRFVQRLLNGVVSAHHGITPVIEIVSETRARGRWAMFDDLRIPAGHRLWGTTGPTRRLGYGHYHEEYRREDDRWRISRMRLERLCEWTVDWTPSSLDSSVVAEEDG